MIRDVRISDAEEIANIYNYYIENTIITFETTPISCNEMALRINAILNNNHPFIISEANGYLNGYAYLDKWRSRPAYDITLETSIYLNHHFTRQGFGYLLYEELIKRARDMNTHSLIGVISLPNIASRKLHNKLGFDLVGNFKECGLKFGQLIDVEFWRLALKDQHQLIL